MFASLERAPASANMATVITPTGMLNQSDSETTNQMLLAITRKLCWMKSLIMVRNFSSLNPI